MKKRDNGKSPFSWHNKWWLWAAIIMCIVFGFTPQIIDWLYPKKGMSFTVTTFNKESLLAFYGSFLAFLGTVALGALALWQNHKLHQTNIRILDNEHKYSCVPQFEILNVTVSYCNAFLPKDNVVFAEKNGQWETDITTHYLEDQDCEISLIIELKNIGEGVAKNLKATYIDPDATYDMISESKDNSIWTEEKFLRHCTRVNQIAYFSYSLPLLMDQDDDDNRSVILEYTNIYDNKYMYCLYINYDFVDHYRFKISVELTNHDTF